MEEEIKIPEKKEWSFRRAIRNTFKWDKGDWLYVAITILILIGGYLYYTETKMCHTTLNHLDQTCESYYQAKQDAINKNNGSATGLNLTEIMKGVIFNSSIEKKNVS